MSRTSTTVTGKKASSAESGKGSRKASSSGVRQGAASVPGKSAAAAASTQERTPMSKRAAAGKAGAARNAGGRTGSAARGVPATSREEMIATAAYFRAEHRGFSEGDPVADWLAAEEEIDAMLHAPAGPAIH